jgi:hypothetical protein
LAFAIEIYEGLMAAVPPVVRASMRVRVREIAKRLEGPPPRNHQPSDLMRGGTPLLEIEGWRFLYRIDVQRKTVVVQQAFALET